MKQAKKKRKADIDNSTRIANMNVAGMPWYVPEKPGSEPGHAKHLPPPPLLSPQETWRTIFTAVGAALLIALVFIVSVFLFILFALHIWLK